MFLMCHATSVWNTELEDFHIKIPVLNQASAFACSLYLSVIVKVSFKNLHQAVSKISSHFHRRHSYLSKPVCPQKESLFASNMIFHVYFCCALNQITCTIKNEVFDWEHPLNRMPKCCVHLTNHCDGHIVDIKIIACLSDLTVSIHLALRDSLETSILQHTAKPCSTFSSYCVCFHKRMCLIEAGVSICM